MRSERYWRSYSWRFQVTSWEKNMYDHTHHNSFQHLQLGEEDCSEFFQNWLQKWTIGRSQSGNNKGACCVCGWYDTLSVCQHNRWCRWECPYLAVCCWCAGCMGWGLENFVWAIKVPDTAHLLVTQRTLANTSPHFQWHYHCWTVEPSASWCVLRFPPPPPPLSYRRHIRNIAVRANRRLGQLKKASPFLDCSSRDRVYKAFVRPIMEYCPLAWMGAAETHLQQLNRVQRRALHIIGASTWLPSLTHRRLVAACTFLYKLFYLPPLSPLRSLLPPKAPIPSRPTRLATSSIQGHSHQLETGLPTRSNSSSLRAFPACVVPIWNALPKPLLKDAPTAKKMQSFKVGVHKHLLRKKLVWTNRLALAPAPPILPYIMTSLYSLLLNPSSTHKCQHPPTPMAISSP